MPFANEMISQKSRENYDLDYVEQLTGRTNTAARDWTVDHFRRIYLREVWRGREEISDTSRWHFFVDGLLFELEIQILSSTGVPGGNCRGTKVVRRIQVINGEVPNTLPLKELIFDALLVYRDGGIYATASSYELVLSFTNNR